MREAIRGLGTKSDPVSMAKLSLFERIVQNHTIRYRMSIHLYRICQAKVRNKQKIIHELEIQHHTNAQGVCNEYDDVHIELEKLRNESKYGSEEPF